MAIDTDTLLAPVDADNPCGDNRNTTPTFWPWRAPPPAKPNSSSAAPSFRKKRRIGCRSNASRPRCWRAPKTCASCCISPALDPAARVAGLRRRADADPPVDTPLLGCSATGIGVRRRSRPAVSHQCAGRPWRQSRAGRQRAHRAAAESAAGEISLRDAGALLDGSKQECPNFPAARAAG